MVVAEAIEQRTPVVYPEWLGIAEYVQGSGVYPLPSTSPNDVAEAIRKAIEGPRVEHGVVERLMWPNILCSYEQLFRRLLDNAGDPVEGDASSGLSE